MKSKCPNCSKPAPKLTTYYSDTQKLGSYRGTILKVLRKIKRHWCDEYILWDGESYKHKYEPFCTLRCCKEYAQMVFMMTEHHRDTVFTRRGQK
jgi:endogenous inhibitor of DNA gyrase (YacG/DUF329 family)